MAKSKMWTGDDLRKWRNRLGYSQTQAAAILGYKHRSAICRYENGHAAVPTRLAYLCEAMEDNAALKGQI